MEINYDFVCFVIELNTIWSSDAEQFNHKWIIYNICFLHLDHEAGDVVMSLIAARSVRYQDSVYVHGGFSGIGHSAVYRITFPPDLCSIYSTPETCKQPGCSGLIETVPSTAVENSSGGNVTICYSNGETVKISGYVLFTGCFAIWCIQIMYHIKYAN